VEIIVFSRPLVNIPNAFTPNGDGVNDIFFITGWEIREATIWVFDRWGTKLFETGSMSEGWDGTFRGQQMQPGVYAYMVRVTYLTGRRELFKGSLTLLR
jgi:gliding motility-associated-like protein